MKKVLFYFLFSLSVTACDANLGLVSRDKGKPKIKLKSEGKVEPKIEIISEDETGPKVEIVSEDKTELGYCKVNAEGGSKTEAMRYEKRLSVNSEEINNLKKELKMERSKIESKYYFSGEEVNDIENNIRSMERKIKRLSSIPEPDLGYNPRLDTTSSFVVCTPYQ